MFPESNRHKNQHKSDVSLPQVIILSILVLALGGAIGFGLLLLRDADKIVASQNPTPSFTPGPSSTPTVAPTATEIPDFSGLEIGIWELPVGFVELSRDEVPIVVDGTSIQAALGLPVNSQFGYQYTTSTGEKSTLVGFTFVLPSAEEQSSFDRHIEDDADIFEQALHPAEAWSSETQPEETFLKSVAEKHAFWHFVRGSGKDTYDIDMLVFRRRGVGAVVYLLYPRWMRPEPDIYTTADLLDRQILNVLMTGTMPSSSTIIDPDNILETLAKAEKRFLGAKNIAYQIETVHTPKGSRVSVTGETNWPDAFALTIFIEGIEFKFHSVNYRDKVILDAVGTDYYINTGIDFNELYTYIKLIVNTAGKLSRTTHDIRREPDELAEETPCFVYATEMDVEEFTEKTVVSLYLADPDKVYSGMGTAKVWINQANFVIQKAHFSIPYTLEEDPGQHGVYEITLIFNKFEE
ncbi:MAG: hypothetical protein ACOYYS_07820 [Chloroflexota bacterium]